MLLGGDELGRSQQGNNNAYCQDNELSWFDWEHIDRELLEFTRRVIQIQAEHPVFRRRGWFKGRPVRGAGVSDIAWFRPDGEEMSDHDWSEEHAKSFAVFLNGDALRELDDDGHPVRDDSFLLLFNAHHEPVNFRMPAASFGQSWNTVIDTAADLDARSCTVGAGESIEVGGRSMVVVSRPSIQ
jgi:isoamylase